MKGGQCLALDPQVPLQQCYHSPQRFLTSEAEVAVRPGIVDGDSRTLHPRE